MFFPRMHSRQPEHIAHYQQYISGRGKAAPSAERDGAVEYLPTFRENLTYFFDYQLGWMYWRYFMWNFAGRQNDIQGHGNSFHGNWECGIPFIDRARLGNVDEMPPYLANHKARNHYYLLPLLLGLAGLLYQLKKDKKNFSVIAVLFVLTGIAIVVYLNQSPNQPRERDYAYAGSFYAFTIWIGLGALAVYELFRQKIAALPAAIVAGGLCILVPVQMGAVNWDDHNRSNRYTARDVAYNYFMSCEKDALIVTVGDNDTFPLWYIQEVEGVRTDVRVVNISLLSADWYIDQMRIRQYDSPPLPIKIARENYLAGTNDYLRINEQITRPVDVREVTAGGKVYSPPRNLVLPVNKENVLKNGTVRFREATVPETDTFSVAATAHADDLNKIPDAITMTIPKTADGAAKTGVTKAEMVLLDVLANNDWERPIYFVSLGGDINLGLRDYLQSDGFANRLTPFRNAAMTNKPDIMTAYDRLKNVYRWGNINQPDTWIDYNTFLSLTAILNIRNMHAETAEALINLGEKEKAVEILDLAVERMPDTLFPYCTSTLQSDATVVNLIEQYYAAGDSAKAETIATRFIEEANENLFFYTRAKNGGEREIDNTLQALNYLASVCYSNGKTALSMASQRVWLHHLKYLRDREPYLYNMLKQKYKLEDEDLN
jgi:tetratricopeptide (TPR) repeat protein